MWLGLNCLMSACSLLGSGNVAGPELSSVFLLSVGSGDVAGQYLSSVCLLYSVCLLSSRV